MPNFSGIWTVTQQMQAKGASTWPATPGAPTIGTATAGSSLCASVTFCAPACTGYPAGVTGYRVISTPGCLTATGASSPITVTGLTDATSYTFKAQATNATGYGPLSCASNSVTASSASSQSYTTAGTYSWVAPTGVTSVSVVAIGGGAGGGLCSGTGGGGLGYKNNYAVTPGSSYTVSVGAGGTGGTLQTNCCTGYVNRVIETVGGASYFVNTSTVAGFGGNRSSCGGSRAGGSYAGDGGGNGGLGGSTNCGTKPGGGGGAGGYAGNGGAGGIWASGGTNATAGSGGGGGGGNYANSGSNPYSGAGGGGGVGLFGQGSNGTAGSGSGGGGGGGSSGTAGTAGNTSTGGPGGVYGGAGGAANFQIVSSPYSGINRTASNGGGGAVRIMWPGSTRSFPSTNAGSP